MGSIRPPHRLKYTSHIDNDRCTHYACNGVKADTEHIFWECGQWEHIRKPYLHQLHLYKSKVSTQGDRKQTLDTLECLPCFRQCGICPGDDRLLRTTYSIPDTDDTKFQFQPDQSSLVGTMHTSIDGTSYLRAYTDGSCTDGTHREKARAGWGVYFAPAHPGNCTSRLQGPVQTSYRAEVVAVLHVVRATKEHTSIRTDCINVAKTLDAHIRHGCTEGR